MVRPVSPAAPMPPMPPMPAMAVPAHFGGHLLRTVLDRRGGAGVAQRQRPGSLSRSGQHEQYADGGKPQNLHHVHLSPPLSHPMSHLRRAADRLGRFAAM